VQWSSRLSWNNLMSKLSDFVVVHVMCENKKEIHDLSDFTLAMYCVSWLSPFLSVCAVAAVWICYSLDALYTTQKNKSHSTCGTRQQLCHFTAHKKNKKRLFFGPSLSVFLCHTLSLYFSLLLHFSHKTCASILVSLNWISLQLGWNHQSKEYKGSLVFVGLFTCTYIYIYYVYIYGDDFELGCLVEVVINLIVCCVCRRKVTFCRHCLYPLSNDDTLLRERERKSISFFIIKLIKVQRGREVLLLGFHCLQSGTTFQGAYSYQSLTLSL